RLHRLAMRELAIPRRLRQMIEHPAIKRRRKRAVEVEVIERRPLQRHAVDAGDEIERVGDRRHGQTPGNSATLQARCVSASALRKRNPAAVAYRSSVSVSPMW